jgi:hypothetical protein
VLSGAELLLGVGDEVVATGSVFAAGALHAASPSVVNSRLIKTSNLNLRWFTGIVFFLSEISNFQSSISSA